MTVLDKGISWCGLRNPGTGFKIPPEWIPDSKGPSFRDSGFLGPDFPIPKSRIADSTSKYFLDSGIRITSHEAKCYVIHSSTQVSYKFI